MGGHRLRLSLLLLVATAAGAAAFGVSTDADPLYCKMQHSPGSEAPFLLGTAVAIHLGNTKSSIAGYDYFPCGKYYQFCIPSWIAFTDNGTLVGEAAMNHAALSPGTAVSGVKRVLGWRQDKAVVRRAMELVPHKFTEHLGWVFIQLEDDSGLKEFSLKQLVGILISELKHTAEAHLGREIKRAVVTVPPRFVDAESQGVRFAGQEYGGFSSVRIVDDPIAAAAAYGHHTKQGDGKTVLVFHLGGRTSVATVFKFINGTAFLTDTRADLFLGGDDFTERVVDYFVELVRVRHGRDVRQDKDVLLRLREACERAKKELSLSGDQQLVQIESLFGGVDFSAPLTQAKFEELNHDLFDRAMGLLDQVAMRRGRPRAINEIVLVGGSTKIPKVRQLVKDYFHGMEPNYSEGLEPDETVVHGAAVISRPEAARYLEECFVHLYRGSAAYYI